MSSYAKLYKEVMEIDGIFKSIVKNYEKQDEVITYINQKLKEEETITNNSNILNYIRDVLI